MMCRVAGFDGIIAEESRIGGQGGTVWNIFDAKNLKIKSQLIEEWNKANKKQTILDKKSTNLRDFKTAEEYADSLDIDHNLLRAYNEAYGKKENTHQYGVTPRSPSREGFSQTEQRGAKKDLPGNIEANISKLSEFINNNPESGNYGSWGNQGIEVACKTWLSGGRVLVNHNTWYAHMFRTQGAEFGFPYPQSGRAGRLLAQNIQIRPMQ